MKNSPKTVLQFLTDLCFFCLMILGVGGVMYKIILSSGWVEKWLGKIWKEEPSYAVVVSVFALGAFLLGRKWLEGFNMKASLGDMIMYGWIILGLVFILRLIVTGSF